MRQVETEGYVMGAAPKPPDELTDRQLLVKVFDAQLALNESVRLMRLGLRLELDSIGERLDQVERHPRETSSHDWTELLATAGKELTARVRDPRDKLDSSRARAIAAEVVEASKEAVELSTWRKLKGAGPWLLSAIAGAIVSAAGVEIMHLLAR